MILFVICAQLWANRLQWYIQSVAKTQDMRQLQQLQTQNEELQEVESGCQHQLQQERVPSLCFEKLAILKKMHLIQPSDYAQQIAEMNLIAKAAAQADLRRRYMTGEPLGPKIVMNYDNVVGSAPGKLAISNPEVPRRGDEFCRLPSSEGRFKGPFTARSSNKNSEKY